MRCLEARKVNGRGVIKGIREEKMKKKKNREVLKCNTKEV